MFLCDKCAVNNKVDELQILFGSRSYGRCEDCGNTSSCIDTHDELPPSDDIPFGGWAPNDADLDLYDVRPTQRAADICPTCAGNGVLYYDGDTPAPCHGCEGTGKRR